MGGTVRRPRRREGLVLPSSTATDLGTGISPSPGSRRRTRHKNSAPARNPNFGASYAAVFSRLAGIPGVEALSESEIAKRYQLQLAERDADACAVAFRAAWWKKLQRPSGDLEALDKLGIDLAMSSAAIDLAPPPVDLVTPEDFKDFDKMGAATIDLAPSPINLVDKVVWEPMKALNQLDGAAGDSPGREAHNRNVPGPVLVSAMHRNGLLG